MASGQMVVLDSSNLDAVVRDATGEGLVEVELPMHSGVANAAEAAAKDAEKAAEPEKSETKADDAADDVEGPDGLTPREKRELTAKMQRAIGKRTLALREAEAFAADQYNRSRLAEQRAEQLEREIARMKAQIEGSKPQPAEEAKAPDRKDFADDTAYMQAMIDYGVEQRFKAKQTEEARNAELARQAEIVNQASARIERAKEIVPDFAEITGAVDTIVPSHISAYMLESELFAELGYHFAKNPDELERVSKLSPARSLVEIGKMESKLTPFAPVAKVDNGHEPSSTNGVTPSTETGSTPSKPRVAAPIRPLSAASSVQVEKAPSERTYAEERAAFQKRAGVNLARRQRH